MQWCIDLCAACNAHVDVLLQGTSHNACHLQGAGAQVMDRSASARPVRRISSKRNILGTDTNTHWPSVGTKLYLPLVFCCTRNMTLMTASTITHSVLRFEFSPSPHQGQRKEKNRKNKMIHFLMQQYPGVWNYQGMCHRTICHEPINRVPEQDGVISAAGREL